MQSCPWFTIARALTDPTTTGRAVCQEKDCALWNDRSGMCTFLALSDAVTSLLAACLVASGIPPLDITPSPPP